MCPSQGFTFILAAKKASSIVSDFMIVFKVALKTLETSQLMVENYTNMDELR